MRKLKLQVQVSVDGFLAGPGGEMDWMTFAWDEALNRHVEGLTAGVDGILLGRKLAEGFIPHWAAVAADPANPEAESGRFFTGTRKFVFSRTLQRSAWPDTDVVAGGLAEAVHRLKAQEGGDLIAYGGCEFVSALVRAGLVDELHLFVNPVALGAGRALFQDLDGPSRLALDAAQAFPCGIAALRYRRTA